MRVKTQQAHSLRAASVNNTGSSLERRYNLSQEEEEEEEEEFYLP